MGRGSAIFDPVVGFHLVAKMTQATTAAPAMAYILENSFPTITGLTSITLARTGTGVYTLTLTGKWTANKTVAKVVSNNSAARVCQIVYTSADVITLNWFDAATPSAADSGDFDLDITVYT